MQDVGIREQQPLAAGFPCTEVPGMHLFQPVFRKLLNVDRQDPRGRPTARRSAIPAVPSVERSSMRMISRFGSVFPRDGKQSTASQPASFVASRDDDRKLGPGCRRRAQDAYLKAKDTVRTIRTVPTNIHSQ